MGVFLTVCFEFISLVSGNSSLCLTFNSLNENCLSESSWLSSRVYYTCTVLYVVSILSSFWTGYSVAWLDWYVHLVTRFQKRAWTLLYLAQRQSGECKTVWRIPFHAIKMIFSTSNAGEVTRVATALHKTSGRITAWCSNERLWLPLAAKRKQSETYSSDLVLHFRKSWEADYKKERWKSKQQRPMYLG